MEKKLLPYLVVISALSVSLSAAFYSVSGIGKMFSGASIQVMIMMGSLEVAKLVLASLLYQYWARLNKALKFYYFTALFVLMLLTSAGIYGYLSSAYSETSNKLENIDKQVNVLNTKRQMFETQLTDARGEKERINQNIAELTKAVSNNFVQTKDRDGNIITTSSAANRKVYEEQLKSSQTRRDDILLKETSLNDSITSIDLRKLELETNTDIAGEIGPLKYIAKLTNKSIDQVINWFIIALMLVFDPLAVTLVVGANVIFSDKAKEKEKLELSKQIDLKIIEFDERKVEIDNLNEQIDNRLKDVESKEKDLEQSILTNNEFFSNRSEELESNYQQKENQLDEDHKKYMNDLDLKKESLDSFEIQINKKIDDLTKDLKIKQDSFESHVKDENQKIENQKSELNKVKQDLDKREKDINLTVQSEIEKAKSKIQSEVDNLNNKKTELSTLKKKIDTDKKTVELEFQKLEKMRDEILEKQTDLDRLDTEIKQWEETNWQMKRIKGAKTPPPPPSAIV